MRYEHTYTYEQRKRAGQLIEAGDVFYGDKGCGYYRGKPYPFVLQDGMNNIYAPIKNEIIEYFSGNGIKWWGGHRPTNHTLSSQIACLNHLFPIRQDREAVLTIAQKVCTEVTDILVIASDDVNAGFIQFEAVSEMDHLNETRDKSYAPTRGSHCTSIDALILAKCFDGKSKLLVIEWKYTEAYGNEDKSVGEKGDERKRRYTELINRSEQLCAATHEIYYIEPFYQLMRQTLWAEQMIREKDNEIIQADEFLHINVIPDENHNLLSKEYRYSNKGMEETWRSCLTDVSKYRIISPKDFLMPIDNERYRDLMLYLKTRYWEKD